MASIPPIRLSVGWTLAFEFTFYLLVALVVALGVKHAAHVLLIGIVALVLIGMSLERVVVWGVPCVLVFGAVLAWGRAGARARAGAGAAATGSGAAAGATAGASPARRARLSRRAAALCGRASAALGDQSYSLYLVHIPVLMALGAALSAAGAHWPPVAVFAVGVTASVLAGALYYRFVEVPLTDALRRSRAIRCDRRSAARVSPR